MTAFEVALIGGLVDGSAAAVIGGLITLTVQGRQHRHEREMATEARLQERRAVTYERIMSYAVRMGVSARRIRPRVVVGAPRPVPDPIPDEAGWPLRL